MLTFIAQSIIEIEERMHAHFKNLLAKLCVMLVCCLSIVPGLSVTGVQVTVLDAHNKDTLHGVFTAKPQISFFQ